MTPVTVQCPSCHASIRLTPEEAARPRVQCRRCGDLFAVPDMTGAAANNSVGDLSAPPPVRLSNATLARLILAVMGCAAVVGLVFALNTVDWRRSHDVHPTTAPGVSQPKVNPVQPADLAALGYLPADCCLVAGIHVAQILDEPDGKKLLDGLNARTVPLNAAQVQNWTGLKPEQINHVAFGLRGNEAFTAWTVVVRARAPYSAKDLEAAMKPAVPTLDESGRPIYRFQQKSPSRMLMRYDDRTLVILLSLAGVELEDLGKLPGQPNTGAAGLPGTIRALLKDQVGKDAVMWSVGNLAKIQGLELALLYPKIPSAVKSIMAGTDLFAAEVRFDKGLTLDGFFHGRDTASTEALQKAIQASAPPDMKLIAPTKKDENWVTVQMSMDADRTAAVLADPKMLLAGK